MAPVSEMIHVPQPSPPGPNNMVSGLRTHGKPVKRQRMDLDILGPATALVKSCWVLVTRWLEAIVNTIQAADGFMVF